MVGAKVPNFIMGHIALRLCVENDILLVVVSSPVRFPLGFHTENCAACKMLTAHKYCTQLISIAEKKYGRVNLIDSSNTNNSYESQIRHRCCRTSH